jgi:hypothetical protein
MLATETVLKQAELIAEEIAQGSRRSEFPSGLAVA